MDDSNEQAGQEEERGGSWLRRRRGAGSRRPETDHEQPHAPAEPEVAVDEPVEREPPPPPPPPLLPKAIWTDSHCHLQDDPDPVSTLEAARRARVGRVVCVGTDAVSSRQAVALAGQLSGRTAALPTGGSEGAPRADLWATVGLHPHDAKLGLQPVTEFIEELSAGEGFRLSRVVAIGECGLDYHYDHSPRDLQRDVFAAQVALANRLELALVVHTREAWDDTFSILDAEGVPERLVFHCFSGGPEEAKRCMDFGGYLSFSGIATFANAEGLRKAISDCPLDSLMIETDSPFLTPVPHRGQRNNPGNVAIVGSAVAKVKGFEPEVLAAVSWMNAEKAFGLGS